MSEKQIIEEIVENAEDLIPELYAAETIVRNNPALLVGVGVLGVAVGATAGYFVARRVLQPKYERLAQEEIQEARERYNVLYKNGEYSTPAGMVEQLIPEEDRERLRAAAEALTTYSEVSEEIADPEEELVQEPQSRNIFVDGEPIDDGDWDYDVEVAKRTTDKPYIITQEEFFENAPSNEQTTVTYYAQDLVLADEADEPIDDSDLNVGDDNLRRFGHGSGDSHTLYVRNPVRQLDFEIALNEGSFAEEVHDIRAEESTRKSALRQRMRADDD